MNNPLILSDFLERIFKTKELTELVENLVDEIDNIGGSIGLHEEPSYTQSFFARRIRIISDELDELYMYPSISIIDINHHFNMITKNSVELKTQYANDFFKIYSDFFDLIIGFGHPKLVLIDGSIPYLKTNDSKYADTFPDEWKIFRSILPSETLELIDYILKMLEMYFDNSKPQNQTLRTYKWLGISENELPELLDILINKEYLAPSTSLKQFETVFAGKTIDNEFKPLKWLANPSELLFFIMKLQELKLIQSPRRMNYNQMKSCFVDDEGNPFKTNFKQMKGDLLIKMNQEKQHKIDNIISKFT